jgi:dihydrofolate reductase
MADSRAGRIEGYAIISEDGMLATAARIMPDSLKFDADQQFFGHGLDGVDVVVHGRHSQERQPHSHLRHRLMLTRSIPALAAHPSNEKALLWNPAGASFEQAMSALGMPGANVGVIGGPDVFGLFLDRYDIFHLTRVPNVRLPGGRPVFPGVPARTPEDVLASHGLVPDAQQILDPAQGLTMVSWRRAAKPAAD